VLFQISMIPVNAQKKLFYCDITIRDNIVLNNKAIKRAASGRNARKGVSNMADITSDREYDTGSDMGEESTSRRRLEDEETV
jgi:hypothetical protein